MENDEIYDSDDDLDKETILEELTSAIQLALQRAGDLSENEILTGWIVCWEGTILNDSDRKAGQMYGPSEMTTWRALGLIEWARRFCLGPSEEED